jgi:hypothetical protein
MRKFFKICAATVLAVFSGALFVQIAEATSPSNAFPKEGWYMGGSVGVTGGRWTRSREERQRSSDNMGTGFSFIGGYLYTLKNSLVLGGEARCDFFANTKEECSTKLNQFAPAVAVVVGYGSTEMRGIIGITLGGAFVRSKIEMGPPHRRGPHRGPPPGRSHRGPHPGPRGPHMKPPYGGPQGPHAHEERDISQIAPELGVFYTVKVGESLFLRTDVRYAFGLKRELDSRSHRVEIQTSRTMAIISIVYHF